MILDLVIKLLLYFCAIAAAVMFLPGNILLDIEPKAFHHSLPKSLDKFTPIENLNVTLFEQIGPLLGPESIAHYKGRLVTGSADGFLYEISSDHPNGFKPLVRIIDHKDCPQEGKPGSTNCGRPLGLQFDSKGVLFVVEPSFGVYRVDNVFGNEPEVKPVLLLDQTEVLGKKSKFLDDLAIEEKSSGGHRIFLSDVSSKFSLAEFILILFGSENGRIIRYDTDTKKLDILADGIFFPNGIEMTQNNEAILFTETAARAVWRYDLKGAKKGSLTKIVTHLPGEPDNVRASASGKSFWVSILNPRTLRQPSEFDYYIKKPLLRKLLGRMAHLAGSALQPIAQFANSPQLLELSFSLKTLLIALPTLFPSDGGCMLEIDQEGKILSSVLSTSTDLGLMSEVREVPAAQPNQRVFYLGSFSMPYLRKLIISK